jgi:hypothetical protein
MWHSNILTINVHCTAALIRCFAVQLDAAVSVLKLYRSEAALVATPPVDSEESVDSSSSTTTDTVLLPAHIRYAERTLYTLLL